MTIGRGDDGTRAADPRAALVLGACAALAVGAAVDAALLPWVDRAAPRALGLLGASAALGAGALLAGRGPRAGRGLLLALGALVLGGGLLAAPWLDALRPRVLARLVDGGLLPYHALVLLAGCLAAAPVALPLGALLERVLRGTGRTRVPCALAGAAVGCLALPYLAEVLLGHVDTLRLAALLAAAAALVAVEHAPLVQRPLRLPLARAMALSVLGAAAALAHRATLPWVELGTLGAPWSVAVLCVGAALSSARAPRTPSAAAAALLAICALPLLPGAQVSAAGRTAPGLLPDVLALLAWALPAGLALGLVVGGDARARDDEPPRGPPWLVALGAAWLLVPVAGWALLPGLAPRGAAAAVAALAVAAALALRARPAALLGGLVAGGLILLGPWWTRPDALPATPLAAGPEADLALVRDPTDGRDHLAFDGRAVLGLSAPQRTRIVDVPLLLAQEPERVLVVAADLGEAAARALLHRPQRVDWLVPVAPPGEPPQPSPFLVRSVGSERLFLAGERPPWDAIVLLPDPRARRRAALHATVEFYAQAAARLTPEGVFCQWWDAADTDVAELSAALASAQRAFPFAYLVMDHPRSRRVQLGVLGTNAALAIRPDRLAEALDARPRVRRDLAAVGLDAFGVSCLVLQHPRMLAILAPPEEALHDGRSRLGVLGGLAALRQPDTLVAQFETFVRWRCDPMAWTTPPAPSERLAVSIEVRDRLAAWQRVADGTRAVVARSGPDTTPFELVEPGDLPLDEAFGLAASLRSQPDWLWAEDEVRAVARRLVRDDLVGDAEGFLREAVRFSPSDAELRAAYGAVLLRAGERDEARAQFERALQLDPRHPDARAALAALGD